MAGAQAGRMRGRLGLRRTTHSPAGRPCVFATAAASLVEPGKTVSTNGRGGADTWASRRGHQIFAFSTTMHSKSMMDGMPEIGGDWNGFKMEPKTIALHIFAFKIHFLDVQCKHTKEPNKNRKS